VLYAWFDEIGYPRRRLSEDEIATACWFDPRKYRGERGAGKILHPVWVRGATLQVAMEVQMPSISSERRLGKRSAVRGSYRTTRRAGQDRGAGGQAQRPAAVNRFQRKDAGAQRKSEALIGATNSLVFSALLDLLADEA
jgi:hypothetical protein